MNQYSFYHGINLDETLIFLATTNNLQLSKILLTILLKLLVCLFISFILQCNKIN